MRRSLAPLALLALVLAPAATSADDERPVPSKLEERVDVQLFQVNFLAVDRKGRPITDLTPDDVEVVDGGTEQKIAFLEPYYRRVPETSGTSETTATATGGEPGAQVRTPAPPPVGRWIVLLFDNYLSEQGTRLKAVEAAKEFVRSRPEPGDRLAVISFDGKLDVLQPFTADRERASLAVERVLGHVDRAVENRVWAIQDLLDQLERCKEATNPWSCAGRFGSAYEDARRRESDALLRGILEVIRSIKPVPDVKTVVLFSNGFSRNSTADVIDCARVVLGMGAAHRMAIGQDYRVDQLFDDLAAEAADAKVSIFTINPGAAGRNTANSAEISSYNSERTNPLQIDPFARSERNYDAALEDVARRTGGEASRSNDVGAALDRIFDVTRGLYTIGYYPNRAIPSASHDVRIKIKRRGVKAVTRRDIPEGRQTSPLVGDLAVATDACSENGRRFASITLTLDPKTLSFEGLDANFVNNFSVYLRVLDAGDGSVLYDDYRFFNITYPAEKYGGGDGVVPPSIRQDLTVPCRPLTVKAIAADAGSGARGEFERDVPR